MEKPDEVEARMGQYLAAFGAGAGSAHVPRAVVALLRARYLPCIGRMVANDPEAWDTDGSHVLDLMGVVGRLAAAKALERGQLAVTPAETEAACLTVERAEKLVAGNTGNCP